MSLYLFFTLFICIFAELIIDECVPGCHNYNPQAGDCFNSDDHSYPLPINHPNYIYCFPRLENKPCYTEPHVEQVCSTCINPVGGIHCPINCDYDGYKCSSSNVNLICEEKYDLKCPTGCKYNIDSDKCVPNTINDICELVEQTLRCPKQCQYNYNLNKCYSQNINTVCEKQKGLICTSMCILGTYGSTCIINTDLQPYSYYPCNFTSNPIYPCNTGCSYSVNYDKCMPNTINDVCQHLNIATCPKDYYFFDTNIEPCSLTNQNKLCLMSNNTIRYPHDIVNTNKCKYKLNIDCSIPRIETCGYSCTFNETINKCIPPKKTMMCGSTFGQTQIMRIPRFNNSTCDDKLMPATIFGYPFCVSKWYYDTY